MTGDDALRLAHDLPVVTNRGAIGINLRQIKATQVQDEHVNALGQALHSYEHSLIPIPISQKHDPIAISYFFAQLGRDIPEQYLYPKSLRDLFQQISQCRMVITASYHAGVFALAQGIPVVTLVGSSYYDQKFYGLQQQFGERCIVVELDQDDLVARLTSAINQALDLSDRAAEPLKRASKHQIEQANQAYERLFQQAATHLS